MQAFTAKGRFANLLREVPVHVVIVNAALLGAAIYGLEQAGVHGPADRIDAAAKIVDCHKNLGEVAVDFVGADAHQFGKTEGCT